MHYTELVETILNLETRAGILEKVLEQVLTELCAKSVISVAPESLAALRRAAIEEVTKEAMERYPGIVIRHPSSPAP